MKSLHLAGPEDLDRLAGLVAAFHAEQGYGTDAPHIRAALEPILAGMPHGAVWLIGPRKAPVGYIMASFGWSLEFGGLDAMVDELYIRPAVRRRGMGAEALQQLAGALRDNGVKALHLEVDRSDDRLQHFYRRARFHTRDGYALMSRAL
ncbi:GNAT family N-acetyltransferase [Salipiger sp. P9]|uniref:GNAT family N-acetyltransferase n=1 Tax=Salipiger pentaromativorans TaxID=2943193 RepID=UPI0021587552|nr:GNAT family N-acetyltransferase [Salipiger pentaromativorans]MCR8547358.1 GNAT family N-acetyltransferase [Salipiger pentaromativorans]